MSLTLQQLAQALQLSAVAVGVETEAQRDWLAAHRCSHAQGCLFGAAVPAQQLAEQVSPLPVDNS